jgi:hypothetical protein
LLVARQANQRQKLIIVPDRATAEWLQAVFPGSTVRSLGIQLPDGLAKGKPGRKRVHATDAEKKRAHREKRRTNLIADREKLYGYLSSAPDIPEGVANLRHSKKWDVFPLEENVRHFVSRFTVQFGATRKLMFLIAGTVTYLSTNLPKSCTP